MLFTIGKLLLQEVIKTIMADFDLQMPFLQKV